MKKTLLITGALLALTVGMASAAGVNLSWTDCGVAGLLNKTFACNNNTGTNTAVSSYVAPAGLDLVNGNEIVIDIQTSGSTVPAWWQFKNTGSCRLTAMSMTFAGFGASCIDYWAGQATGSFSYTAPFGSANRARVLGVCAVSNLLAGPIALGDEVYSNNLTINNSKSMGTGACAGCADGACIVLNSIRITQSASAPAGAKFLGNPANRNFVTWQNGVLNCGAGVTPARNATWGSVKALYR